VVVRRGWTDERVLVPAALFESADAKRVRLRVTREEAARRAAEVPVEALLATGSGSEIRVPIAEERLIPDKRAADLGELRIHKYVDHVEDRARQPVTVEEVVVERVPVNRPLAAGEALPQSRIEGDYLVVPVVEEVLVVQKRLMLKEEVRVHKRQVAEEREVRAVLRRERVELEDATARGVQVRETPSQPPATSQRADGSVKRKA
jgi:uncharacterized protein (TIGR02271 family)